MSPLHILKPETRHLVAQALWAVVLGGLASALAGDAPDGLRLVATVDLSDGSRVIGMPQAAVVPLTAAFGKTVVPFAQVSRMEVMEDHERVRLFLANGDRLSGVADLGSMVVSSAFGVVSIPLHQIRQIGFARRAEAAADGLVLWNSLDSREEVRQSRHGPGGEYRGGEFTEGVRGNALAVNWNESSPVVFPREVIHARRGCVEFWARLLNFPSQVPDGENPSLFRLLSPEGTFALQFNANDGCGKGGLCAWAGSLHSAATGSFGSWTYEQILGAREVDAWHHYALVWDADGIAGVDNGRRNVAVFLDGRLQSRVWQAPASPIAAQPTRGELALMVNVHLRQGRILLDEFRVWNVAKTDFRDSLDIGLPTTSGRR